MPANHTRNDESIRLASLREHMVLDTPAEDRFDRIAEMAKAYFQAPIALVSLIDRERQWFKASIGLQPRETPREWAFCHHAIQQAAHSVFVLEDTLSDARFCQNPLVTGDPGIRFYAGAVLTAADGQNLGTLCVIDTKPRQRPQDVDLNFLVTLAKMVVDQLELSKARTILDEHRRLLQNAEAMSGVGHWRFDLISQSITWSDEVYRIHGFPISEKVPSYEELQQYYHEEDRAQLVAAIDRATACGEGYSLGLRIMRPDGQVRHTLAMAECVLDHTGRTTSIFGVFQDVTAHHIAAAELAKSEEKYRLLADNARDVIALYGVDGVFRYVSPSVLGLLGYSPAELLGKTPFVFVHVDDRARVIEEFRAAAEIGKEMTIEYRALTKGGDVRWLEAKPRFQRDNDGNLIEISDSVRDVTERRVREAALHQARLEAEKAAKAKTTFLANMSHEIRTPMNGVIGFAELLAQSQLDAEQRRQVELIVDSGRSMMQLLNDILDISKVEAGQMHLADEPVDIRAKMQTVAHLLEPAARAKGVALSVHVAEDVPPMLWGDTLRLRQVMLNLAGNAVKFTERGAVWLNASVDEGADGKSLRIDVGDTGIGIAADKLESIFETFGQADATIARRFGGTGLGLAITRQLVNLMGGQVRGASELGKGSVFSLFLPLRTDRDRPLIAESPSHADRSNDTASQLGKPRVLLAEDHLINQELMRGLTRKMEIELSIATTGQEAIDMVKDALAQGTSFDLVLMDIQMPEMDGLEATRHLRALGFGPEALPVIALTANAYAEDVAACLAAGMQGHLSKPVRVAELKELIDRNCRAGFNNVPA